MLIAITRLEEKSTDDGERCERFGHRCIAVSPLAARINQDEISRFVREADRCTFDCIFFTSALPARLIGPHLSRWPRVIAIGPQTQRELGKFGIEAEVLDSFYSHDFVPYVGDWIAGKIIGIPRADVPNPGLISSIEAAGGRVTEYRCYSLVPTREPLQIKDADAILFTSAMSFKEAVWEDRPDLIKIAIGRVTAKEMEHGDHPPDVSGDGSLEGALRTLNEFLEKNDSAGLNQRT
ncbi:MAG: uroporphyrinogen-III synthase [Methanoregulaceae archaeon PtaB.Bin108]|nr:MAG: uroporphyrinogen-III synthase [Methanoregulaceae archaeon PtaB.Bin108]